MNNRQRFHATMHYLPRDRSPIYDFGFWDETLPAWHNQGLPPEANQANSDRYFGMDAGLDRFYDLLGVEVALEPAFAERTIEDLGDREVFQQGDGVRVLRQKSMGTIPKPLSYVLVDRESWKKHYLPRLDPTTPGRFPADWEARLNTWKDPERSQVIALPGGSLYGHLRNWMGMENLSLALYDDPAWFAEMVTTVADCTIETLRRVLETGGCFDGCGIWEDMAYNAGPLLSPRHFKRYLSPHYRRLADLLHRYGVDIIWVDCDGRIDSLLPLWLEAGINCMFPVEVGTWGADPLRYRQEYGPDLRIMGGFDKHILAGSKDGIAREVDRLAPLVADGGFIGFCDHRVPPDVSLDNYLFYLEQARLVWGQGVNLEPIPEWWRAYRQKKTCTL